MRRKQDEDSDSDTDMIDETGNLQNKKIRRDSESSDNSNVDNYETLNKKWSQINEELCKLRVKLANIGLKPHERSDLTQESGDSLDDFMATINRQKYGLSMNDKIEKSNLRLKINLLIKEQQKLEKLIKLAKPCIEFESIPQSIPQSTPQQSADKLKPSLSSSSVTSNQIENIQTNEPKVDKTDEIDRKEAIKRKTEVIINELKKSSKQSKSELSLKSSKQKLKPQSIVDAIEKEKKLEKSKQNVLYDSDYVDWLPPTNQSGDGKTPLNEKLGY